MPPESPHVLLTVAETAALLRTTPKAVYAMIERGQLAGVVRVGRRVLVDRVRLLAALGVLRSAPDEKTSDHVGR
jgi:excisionase family DNA binding protein